MKLFTSGPISQGTSSLQGQLVRAKAWMDTVARRSHTGPETRQGECTCGWSTIGTSGRKGKKIEQGLKDILVMHPPGVRIARMSFQPSCSIFFALPFPDVPMVDQPQVHSPCLVLDQCDFFLHLSIHALALNQLTL